MVLAPYDLFEVKEQFGRALKYAELTEAGLDDTLAACGAKEISLEEAVRIAETLQARHDLRDAFNAFKEYAAEALYYFQEGDIRRGTDVLIDYSLNKQRASQRLSRLGPLYEVLDLAFMPYPRLFIHGLNNYHDTASSVTTGLRLLIDFFDGK